MAVRASVHASPAEVQAVYCGVPGTNPSQLPASTLRNRRTRTSHCPVGSSSTMKADLTWCPAGYREPEWTGWHPDGVGAVSLTTAVAVSARRRWTSAGEEVEQIQARPSSDGERAAIDPGCDVDAVVQAHQGLDL